MRLKSVSIENYQCFERTELLEFESGLNLIVGKNSTGKSALLRALSLHAVGAPHLSLRSKPTRTSNVNSDSLVDVDLEATGTDLRTAIHAQERVWNVPAPNVPLDFAGIAGLWEQVFARNSIEFRCRLRMPATTSPVWEQRSYPAAVNLYPLVEAQQPARQVIGIQPDRTTGGVRYASGPQPVSDTGDAGTILAQQIAEGMYRFDAERLHLAKHSVGVSKVLLPDARNLAEVLDNLRENAHLFSEYQKLVREVFPSVTSVTLRSIANHAKEIMLWSIPVQSGRDDLAISLEHCGTGIGQVLAILYVVSTSFTPCTLLIDEPNSFLHPGAARALIRIFKRFDTHQYVIATHSPEVISEMGAARIFHLTWNDGRTSILQFPSSSVDTAAGLLGDLGARLSDVLGYERVLWVEGPSDADCFMLLARQRGDEWRTTAILPVRSTSSLNAVDLRDVLYLHRQLSVGRAPVPPSVGFIFDRDGRAEGAIADLVRESQGAMHFLPRRMLENYFLDPTALAALLNNLESPPIPFAADDVRDWIAEQSADRKYLAHADVAFSELWLLHVHGAQLLHDLLESFTEARQVYRKTVHAPWLTAWHLKNLPGALADLDRLIEPLLGGGR